MEKQAQQADRNPGCLLCPVSACDAMYRGSRCAAERTRDGVDYDPEWDVAKMKPILMNTKMVQAVMAGKKDVTRRAPFQCEEERIAGNYRDGKKRLCALFCNDEHTDIKSVLAPYDKGDILYVRETWCRLDTGDGAPYFAYCADDDVLHHSQKQNFHGWKPSIHMPREAARLFLHVRGVYLERLNEMREADFVAEGFRSDASGTAEQKFIETWNGTLSEKKRESLCWDANPWVWLVYFTPIEHPIIKKGEKGDLIP